MRIPEEAPFFKGRIFPAETFEFSFQFLVGHRARPSVLLTTREATVRSRPDLAALRSAALIRDCQPLRGDFGPIGPGAGDHDTRASHALQAARL
jgi:hypothetical protein